MLISNLPSFPIAFLETIFSILTYSCNKWTNVKHRFTCLLAMYTSSLEKVKFFAHFQTGFSFYCWALKILYISPFSDIWFTDIFFHSVHCLFTSCCLFNHKSFTFWSSPIYFFFCCYAFGVIFKKPILNPKSQKFTPMLSSTSFIILVLTFRFFFHFELVSGYGVR